LLTSWIQVVTPNGRIGFAAPGALALPFSERLCYAKDIAGRWHIAGFVGAGE
jgi:hypothetical protein